MKQIGLLVFIILILYSCTSSKKATSTQSSAIKSESSIRNGTSYEKAIIILEKTEGVGVDAEYKWLKSHYPGYKTIKQVLNYYKKKPYDIISITTIEGKDIDVYFDISKFYGKL